VERGDVFFDRLKVGADGPQDLDDVQRFHMAPRPEKHAPWPP
jgi:hypothetical protein